MRHGVRLFSLLFLVFLVPAFLGAVTFNVNIYTDVADITPDGVCDSCSLREAIQEANFLVGPDIINVPPGTYTMDLAGSDEDASLTGDLDILDDVTIIGIGTTRIESNVGRIIHVISGSVSITGLTLLQGDGAGDQQSGRAGGAIHNAGTGNLTLNNCTMDTNAAPGGGGGIFNGGNLTLSGSTLTNNSATGSSRGGAIYNSGTMTITNCTLVNNSATDGGGGIHTTAGSTLTVNNLTLTNNSSTGGVGGGGINSAVGSTVNLSNSIMAFNTASGPNDDCEGAMTSGGGNIVRDSDGCTGLIAGDVTGVDPMLGPLQNNGGRTETRALLALSPALNTGGATACELLDQRTLARPQDTGCDIGSFEFFPGCPVITLAPVSPLTDGTTGTFYTQTITPTGGVSPYTFAVTAGALPPGFALNSASGILSGVATSAGAYNFTITAFDANFCPGSLAYSINIIAGPANCGGGVTITLTPTILPVGNQGVI